jgi:hypothetical protein
LNDPGLTAERFVPDPLAAVPGARLYRTGDVGRRLRDGSIDLLGRADQQIKIRGHRIELGDVEAAFGRVAGVATAVAIKRHDEARGDELVVYVVADASGRFDLERAKAGVAALLPAHMIPSAIVEVDELPLTANQKVDRTRLAARALAAAERPADRLVAPRTALETMVRGIWHDVLGKPSLSIDDNFFDVGGHSLLMAQVHERLQRGIGRHFPLVTLLERPTIRGIAEFLDRGAGAGTADVAARAQSQRQALATHRAVAARRPA